MTLYVFNIILILYFSLIIYHTNIRIKDSIFLLITMIPLTIISALRHSSIGTDTVSYLLHFRIINDNNVSIFNYSMEPLFVLLNKLSYMISTNPQIILAVSSIIISLFLFKRIIKSSPYPWLSIYLYLGLYLFYQSLNGTRQYIAVAIMFYFSKYIFEKKLLRFLFGIVLAMGFHQTAIVFVPLYLINYVNQNRYVKIAIYGLFIGLLLNFNLLLSFFISLFPSYEVYQESLSVGSGGIRDIVIALSILSIGKFVNTYFKNSKSSRDLETFMYIYLFTSIMSYLSSGNLVQRIGWYFSIFAILYIPSKIKDISNESIRNIVLFVLVFLIFIFHTYLLSTNFHRVTPYRTFF